MTRKASRRSRLDKSAIDVVEEAVHLLRVSAPGVLAYYYIGSLPFVLGLIYFWAYMSASAVDEGTCAAAALGMAVLLVWMKSWQAVFAAHATAQLTGQALARPTGRSVLRIAAAQAIIQPWGFILLPVAAVATLPFGWAYAFYQNATVLGGEDSDLRGLFQKARHQAMLWPRQNHFLLALLFLLGVFVLANLAVVIYLMPQLWRTLFGVETVFAKGSWHMLNTTFLAATCALSYLCMDPLVKAVYVVRCFHGASLHSGADLKAELRVRQRAEKLGAALLVAWLAWHGVCVPRGALAAGRPEPWVAIGGEAYRQPVGILGVSP